jgi:hypothetical protein
MVFTLHQFFMKLLNTDIIYPFFITFALRRMRMHEMQHPFLSLNDLNALKQICC